MVMAEYFTHDRQQELWHQIYHLHLTYLDTEDSPQKIEQRNKLEVCIRDFLCIAPHNRKFYCQETAEVLHRSASSKKDFSGYRAALAWNAVSMYAGNLLSQPWRKEYRQIKTYCGFYKHQIEANLVGAEAMFEAMGYKHAADGVLVLEGPVCPDRVTNVSLDSIVAFVECQILKTIWEEVSTNFKVSWLDVLEFRESHLCSPDQSIRILNYRFHERRYQQQQQQQHHHQQQQQQHSTTDTYSPLLRYSTPVMHAPAPYAQCPAHCVYGGPAHCVYGGTYFPSYASYAPVPQGPYHVGTMPGVKPCNGYCYPNGAVAPQGYGCPVPTAQLIELDNTQNGLDVSESAARLDAHKQLARATNLDSLTLSKSKEDGAGTFESWDYVYRNLESQGYYKDLGDRPDVLQSMTDKKKHSLRDSKKTKPSIELEDELSNLNLTPSNNHLLKTIDSSTSSKKLKDNKPKVDDYKIAQSSSYDNITQPQPPPIKSMSNGVTNPTKNAKTLPRERASLLSPEKPANHTTLDTKKLRKQDSVDKVKQKANGSNWNCNTCTYLNKGGEGICVMCGKSKRSVEHKMAVGGPQCPRCTLVNQKDASVCQACETSLLNSPTYI